MYFECNYLRTFLWVLYSVPPQNGDRPAETKKYKMTPTLHISEAGEAWLHLMTSGDINSKVPHMLMFIESPPPIIKVSTVEEFQAL